MTGLLRREERAVDDARLGAPYDFDTLDLDISDRYVFDEQAAAGSAPLAFGLAAVLAGLAMVILVGLAGGYLIYRRADRSLPLPASSSDRASGSRSGSPASSGPRPASNMSGRCPAT